MAIVIKEADLDKDMDTMVSILNDNRKTATDVKRLQWLYRDNPHGKATSWFVIDDKTGDIAGFTSALPREMLVFGQRMLCWNCCDFSIQKKYRTLGVAVKLRKVVKDEVDKNAMPFLYAHPNDRMKVVHLKVGHYELGQMVRYVKLLRIDNHLQQRIKYDFLSKPLSLIGNTLILLSNKVYRTPYSHELIFNKSEFRFDGYFDELFQKAVDNKTIYGVRSSEYLNWRYIDCPLYSTEVAVLKKKTELLGYIVFFIEGKTAVLKDIFCVPDSSVEESLLLNWIQSMNKRDIHSLSVILLNSSKWIRILKKYGFIYRADGTSTVIVYPNPQNQFAGELLNKDNWFMTVGDRDV